MLYYYSACVRMLLHRRNGADKCRDKRALLWWWKRPAKLLPSSSLRRCCRRRRRFAGRPGRTPHDGRCGMLISGGGWLPPKLPTRYTWLRHPISTGHKKKTENWLIEFQVYFDDFKYFTLRTRSWQHRLSSDNWGVVAGVGGEEPDDPVIAVPMAEINSNFPL